MKAIRLIDVPSELGAGTRGASLGSNALFLEDVKQDRSVFRIEYQKITPDNDVLLDEPKHPKAKYLESLIPIANQSASRVKESLEEGVFPLLFLGDHSNAYGTIAGLDAFLGDKKLGVLWIDAHADLHSPSTTPSGNIHGMPLGMALGLEVNGHSSVELKSDWDRILNIGSNINKIGNKDVVFMGVRSTEKPEEELMAKHGFSNISVSDFRKMGIEKAMASCYQKLSHCDFIHVSFDVDSMDPSVSKGTGTPVPGGFLLEEAVEINKAVAAWEKLISWEITEINPLLDTENRMAKAGYQVVKAFIESFQNRN